MGAKERITSVTSFRPRSPHVPDDTVLTSVRPVSDLSELYYDFGEYRLEISAFKKFLAEQEAFVKHTNQEIVEEDKVMVGHIDEVDYPDEKVGAAKVRPTAERAVKRARVG